MQDETFVLEENVWSYEKYIKYLRTKVIIWWKKEFIKKLTFGEDSLGAENYEKSEIRGLGKSRV